jgi:hypothetical protein
VPKDRSEEFGVAGALFSTPFYVLILKKHLTCAISQLTNVYVGIFKNSTCTDGWWV